MAVTSDFRLQDKAVKKTLKMKELSFLETLLLSSLHGITFEKKKSLKISLRKTQLPQTLGYRKGEKFLDQMSVC
jgi:hypothetical protein